MADWGNVQQGMVSGYQMGKDTGGGRVGQLGNIIKKVADRLRSERETGEAMTKQKELLGVEGLIKGTIEPTQEGGFELPGVGRLKKAGLESIPEGYEISGYSTSGQPLIRKTKPDDTLESKKLEETIKLKVSRGEELTGEEINYYNTFMVSSLGTPMEKAKSNIEKPLPVPVGKINPLRLLPGYANYGEDKEGAYNVLRSRGISEKEAKKRLNIK